jgi:SAM-dependent methyltransferase
LTPPGDEAKAERAASFGQAADVYERSRPDYPAAAIDWLLPEGAVTVLDLGAGTGKLTRALLERGLEVIAVEPADEMRATLAAAMPEALALAGTAESIPLPDSSVDAITVAQAWHWVDPAVALPEAARVLRPGGTLGLVWNRRDERVPWVARLSQVMGSSDAELLLMEEVEIGPPFGPTETSETDWGRPMDLDLLLDMIRSRSYFITADAEHQAKLLDGTRALVESDPDLKGSTAFDLPYRTHCFRATAPG